MNILSGPLINNVILFSFQNREVISNLYLKKMRFSIYSELCSTSLHVVITAYNSLKQKFNFIKYKMISKCTYIFLAFCVFQLNKILFFPIYFIIEDLKKRSLKISSRSRLVDKCLVTLLVCVCVCVCVCMYACTCGNKKNRLPWQQSCSRSICFAVFSLYMSMLTHQVNDMIRPDFPPHQILTWSTFAPLAFSCLRFGSTHPSQTLI